MGLNDGRSDRVRSALIASEDPRAERTRAQVVEAVRVLGTRDQPITVSALVREAGVSRSAFYTHFAGLDDVAQHMQAPHITEIAARAAADRGAHPHAAMREAQRSLAEHFSAYRSLYAAAFSLPQAHATADLESTLRTAIAEHIRAIGGPPAGLREDITAAYVSVAATRVIEEWVTGRIAASTDEIAEHLYLLMPAWLHAGPTSPAPADDHGKEDQ